VWVYVSDYAFTYACQPKFYGWLCMNVMQYTYHRQFVFGRGLVEDKGACLGKTKQPVPHRIPAHRQNNVRHGTSIKLERRSFERRDWQTYCRLGTFWHAVHPFRSKTSQSHSCVIGNTFVMTIEFYNSTPFMITCKSREGRAIEIFRGD
jgi:hypothetical protein